VPVLLTGHETVLTGHWVQDGVVIFNKFSYKFLYDYRRGDIALIKSPAEPGRSVVGKIVGLESDWVSLDRGEIKRVPKGSCAVQFLEDLDGRKKLLVPLALLMGRACFSIGSSVTDVSGEERNSSLIFRGRPR
jgi:hypothetical protein